MLYRESVFPRLTFVAILLLCFLFFEVPASANNVDLSSITRVHQLTRDGLTYLFNFELDQAELKFNQALTVDAGHPRPLVSKSLAPLWRYMASRSPADYDEVIARIGTAIEAGEVYLNRFEKDPIDADARNARADVLASLGTAYGNRAYAHSLNKSYLKAAWDGKKSYDYMRDALATDPRFYDAYLGIGLLHFGISFIPKPLQWIVGILGIDGDRELGLREIEMAGRRGMFSVAEAKYYLAQFLPWVKGDFEGSEKLLDELVLTYPKNTVFLYARGFLALRHNDVEKALSYFVRMKEARIPYFAEVNAFADFRIGDCRMRRGEFILAREPLLAFLAVKTPFQFEAVAAYYAGLSFEMAGDRSLAIPLYRRAAAMEAKHGDDVYSARKAATLVASSLSSADSLIVLARLALRRGDYEESISFYNATTDQSRLTVDQRGEALYGIGECRYELKQYEKAARHFRSLLTLNVTAERWVIPWSHFMLGQIALKKNDVAAAVTEFKQVLEFDDYDNRNWLNFRAEQELEKIEGERQEALSPGIKPYGCIPRAFKFSPIKRIASSLVTRSRAPEALTASVRVPFLFVNHSHK